MDGFPAAEKLSWHQNRAGAIGTPTRRWRAHSVHAAGAAPHRLGRAGVMHPPEIPHVTQRPDARRVENRVELDGSRGEGGGQILRTALALSLITGRPFRMINIRANRSNPGLRPQHCKAALAAAELGHAKVTGATVGARELTFVPGEYELRDLTIDIGTAGSTSLVLQTLHLPLALRSLQPLRLVLTGGTFNSKAPAFAFLASTWRAHLAELGMPVAVSMPVAGFYPRGGGQLEAWIEPARPRAITATVRGPLQRLYGTAGIANLSDDIARRMRDRAIECLKAHGIEAEIELVRWSSPGQGAAISLTAEHGGIAPATFVGLGERGKRSEAVADEAVTELLAFEAVDQAAVDPYAADQILLPLSLAEGRSEFTASAITEHLRTNAQTIAAFLDRSITIDEPPTDSEPGRVVVT
jgi:RNA 3'-terminal phosphate cyclase (ATP)